jgi:hypothetical protein
MKNAVLALAPLTLSLCFVFSLPVADISSKHIRDPALLARDERGPVSADINDSDQFFQSNIRTLSFIGTDNKPVAEPGDFDVMIGGLSDRFTLK